MYEIKYLPIAVDDLRAIADYITDTLKAPEAAMDLMDAIHKAVISIQQFPYSRRVYSPIQSLENEYRLLPVKNYAVFYTVKGQVVEIHRMIYAKRDLTKGVIQ
ncbi:plasmid stabilization system [Bacillus sp. OxB-1]|uniref:type II toxin-antitoxin system RelE/ParE family toxin n=1 Tax=Bacillus sp. (strain OxB-1) TaxID=98228 RepID=UPI0005822D20|nr:type II toxin-antitoxin system RelE/ParE family toxin [Bacillus sp. OxB-1]BAQ10174.1 plasmid stabilization system [Bacillus sp. OxB-1]